MIFKRRKKKTDIDTIKSIFKGLATPFELMEMHDKTGREFVIEDGKVTRMIMYP